MIMRTRVFAFVALALVLSRPASATTFEAAGPFVVVSPTHYATGSDALLKGTFYNPTAIRVGNKLYLFAQGGMFDDADSPWPTVCGDEIVMFRADWTFEGLRSPMSPVKRISPNGPYYDNCGIHADWYHYGNGSVLFSEADDSYYIFLDKVDHGAMWPDDFKEVLVGICADPTEICSAPDTAWEYPTSQTGYAAPLNPLIRQTLIPLTSTVVSVIDVTVAPEGDQWLGFFRWGTASGWPKVGRVRITPVPPADPRSDRSLLVEILSGGEWLQVGDDGELPAIPDAVWSSGSTQVAPTSIFTADGVTQAWGGFLGLPASDGCDDLQGGQSTALASFSIVGEGTLERRGDLASRVRAMPSINTVGPDFPVRLRHDIAQDHFGQNLLYSSSGNNARWASHADPPLSWGSNLYVGHEVVLTILAQELIADSFTNTTQRSIGSALDGSQPEVGNQRWLTGGPAEQRYWDADTSIVLENGYVTNGDNSGWYHIAEIPIDPTDYPDDPVFVVEADVNPAGSEWVGIGFFGTGDDYWHDGQLWMLLKPDSSPHQLQVFTATDCLIAMDEAPAFHPGGSNHLRIAYDKRHRTASAWINSVRFVDQVVLSTFPCAEPVAFQNVALHLYNPANSAGNLMKVDNFSVTPSTGGWIFEDGFETGSTDRWSETGTTR